MISLGCPKNLVDSEKILGRLRSAGCDVVADPEQADVILINTCGFIGDAKRESIATILEMARLKQNTTKRLVAIGCLVERYAGELVRSLPEVDAFVGVRNQDAITDILGLPRTAAPSPRAVTGPGHYAYLKIAEGCDLRCSFCAIPGIHGPQRSRAIEEVVEEAEELAGIGATEIILVAQDTSGYGRDLPGGPTLARLAGRLAEIRAVRWIRLNYLYPSHVTRDLIETIAGEPKVCKYADIPLQHSDRSVLSSMLRGGSRKAHLRLIEQLRREVPGIFIRSAFIVGYPAETPARFESLLGFLSDARLEHVGIFTYSREDGTSAWKLGDSVPAREKRRRRAAAMRLQRTISLQANTARIGEIHDAVVDAVRGNYYICRVMGQAPEIDGVTRVRRGGPVELQPGDRAVVRISRAGAYDLDGDIVSGI
ncbi:MAG: 30S ribosomal protein S12 methylthiotransferase RimO [Acidobacteriota bacterium]